MIQSDLPPNIQLVLNELYTKTFDEEAASFINVYSHGSDRLIIRIFSDKGKSVIGVYNPNLEENKAFLGFTEYFKAKGLNVPEIFSVSEDSGAYLMEDLGSTTLFKRISDDKERFSTENTGFYKQAINNLVKIQIESCSEINFSLCYQFNEFGKENIEFDLNYFKQRFLGNFYKRDLDFPKLDEELNHLKFKLLELPRDYFLYRDFQSRNIMLHKNDLYFIDYQSGRKGALQYDIASLLYDAKADIPQNLREEFLEYYIKEAGKYTAINPGVFKNYFWYFAVIRILQAMGAYGFLGITKGKEKFLESIPYALKNISFILDKKIEKNEFTYLNKIFSEIV